jgi:hypothetical protein
VTSDLLLIATSVGIVAGLILTVATVVRLVRIARQPELARAPVSAVSRVAFDEAGDLDLAIEGPLFTSRFRGLSFAVVDAAGVPVALRRLWMRASSGGFSRTRLSLYRVALPLPGTYELRVDGLDPAVDYGECAVVFVRPYGASLFVTVVSLLASVGLTAASLAVAGALFLRAPAEVPAPASAETERRPPPRMPIRDAADGHRLAVDPSRLGDAREIVWPILELHVRVPSDWVVRTLSTTDLDLRHPTTSSTFLIARVTPMPAGPTFEDYVEAHVAHAREQLAGRLIDGYATKRLGSVPGVLTLERREDGLAIVAWTGFQPAAVGSLSVTLLTGAAAADFARDESLLGAILESVRFE